MLFKVSDNDCNQQGNSFPPAYGLSYMYVHNFYAFVIKHIAGIICYNTSYNTLCCYLSLSFQ